MNKHMPYDLKQMQSLPLEAKIMMTQRRIRDWYDYWDGQVYVSFSGGKDSTVLKHIVDNTPGVYDVPAVFVNTGLEYPEIQQFVREVKAGKYDCFNPNVEMLRPEMKFGEVLSEYGYPIISKEVSRRIRYARAGSEWAILNMKGLNAKGEPHKYIKGMYAKWEPFVEDAPFNISDQCCAVMKEKPLDEYAKITGRKAIIGTLASESQRRRKAWIKTGCNAFESKKPMSKPLSFWTNQDILHYLKKFNVPYCPVYGDIIIKETNEEVIDGQINMIDFLEDYEPQDTLTTTGCDRTGCIFCMFGCHLEKEPNRFQRLKQTHPRQYEYCINGGEYTDVHVFDRFGAEIKLRHCTYEQIEKWIDSNRHNRNFQIEAKWQPSKEGLGLGHILDYMGVKY